MRLYIEAMLMCKLYIVTLVWSVYTAQHGQLIIIYSCRQWRYAVIGSVHGVQCIA